VWNFLSDVLEQAGIVAALYMLTLVGVAFGMRVLWKAHTEALEKLAKVQKEEAEKQIDARKSYEAERISMRDEHNKELRSALKAYQEAAAKYAERLDALQERRVTEMRDVTTKLVQHIASIDSTVGKLGTAVDVLVRISDQGKVSRYGK